MRISTNWLKDFVTLAPPLEQIAERLTLAGLEVKKVEPSADRKDLIFEIEITSNRPDWLSHYGVAREIAAVENLSLKNLTVETAANRPVPAGWKVGIRDLGRCPYYTGVYMEGVMANVPTPDFIKDRLFACNMRSISLLVDITNFVLLETGQPLHVFDADLIHGQEIQVRAARQGEILTVIDGAAKILNPTDLVIAEKERAIALAGVMGGKDTEVSDRTRNIFLESAFFHPSGIRQTARRLALASESSYRFERRVDPDGVDWGRERAVALIQQYTKPRFVSGVVKAGQKPVTFPGRIHLSGAEIEKCLGVKIKPHQVQSVLLRLGFDVKSTGVEAWNIGVPSFRSDVTRPVDLVEEVARIYGYDKIPETLPAREPMLVPANPKIVIEEKARGFFCGQGFSETVTFSLVSEIGLSEEDLKQSVPIVNPQNRDLKWMRPTFAPSLLGVVQKNVNAGAKRMAFFEIANVYRQPKPQVHPEEEKTLGIALSGVAREKVWLEPSRNSSFYDLKGLVESFLQVLGIEGETMEPIQKSFLDAGSSVAILKDKKCLGFMGEVHAGCRKNWDLESPVFYAELSLDQIAAEACRRKTFKDLPKYPSVERDISIVVQDSISAGEIQEEIRKLGGQLVKEVTVFDLFRGGRVPAGHKNLAFRITYQSPERTLVSDEIKTLQDAIAASLIEKYRAAFQQ